MKDGGAERAHAGPFPLRRDRDRTGLVAMVSLHPMSPGHAASTHVHSIAGGLADLGWEVTLVAVRPGTDNLGLLSRVVRWICTVLRAVGSLRRVDVVYVRSHPAAAPLVMAAKLLRVPVVVEVNGPDEDYLVAWPQLRRAPWLVAGPVRAQLRVASAIVAVTDGLARWVGDRSGGRPTVVIPNGVDPERFSSGSPLAGHGRPYVVFIGALAPWQGIDRLLDATERTEWPGGVALVIAGDGPEGPRVRKAVERRPERVRWLGHVSPEDVPALLDGALAAIVLSRDRHGTGVSPIKLYEAMAAGTPVIVSDVPGAADTVLAAQCGIVVAEDDDAAIATAISRLADDPIRAGAMGQRGRTAAAEQHSWSRRAAATGDLLAWVARGPGAS